MSDVRSIFAAAEQTPLVLTVACELCDQEGRLGTAAEGGQVSRSLSQYREPLPPLVPGGQRRRYTTPTRCNDHQACRDRYEEGGEDWPFVDATTKSTVLLTTGAGTAYAASLPSLTPEPAAVETGADHSEAMTGEPEWEGF